MADTFSAADVVGKSLIAARSVSIYASAADNAAPIATVAAGQTVGVVWSWLDPGPGRTALWWIFQAPDNSYYYTPHVAGNFSVKALQDQGVLTDAEKKAAEDAANAPWYSRIIDQLKWPLLIGGVAVAIAPALVNNIFKSGKSA